MKLALNLLLAIMTAVTLAFGVGCGGGEEATETEAPAEQATGGEETAPEEAAPPAEEAPANPCGEAGNPCGEAAP
ncbi:MAG: hypothetical protein HYY06_07245 [Deltaproteobacteria bacterium]|nr:hypothetical protein [Deltaproteobacteria bacterium]